MQALSAVYGHHQRCTSACLDISVVYNFHEFKIFDSRQSQTSKQLCQNMRNPWLHLNVQIDAISFSNDTSINGSAALPNHRLSINGSHQLPFYFPWLIIAINSKHISLSRKQSMQQSQTSMQLCQNMRNPWLHLNVQIDAISFSNDTNINGSAALPNHRLSINGSHQLPFYFPWLIIAINSKHISLKKTTQAYG